MDKSIFRALSYGVYILGVHLDGRDMGCAVNSVMQITSEPPVIAVSVNHSNYTNECLKNSGYFSVNILSESVPADLIETFGFSSSRSRDKFADFPHTHGPDRVPVLSAGSCGWMAARIIGTSELSTHTVFFAQVEDAQYDKAERPMTYAFYHSVKNGQTPKAAPSYIEPSPGPAVWTCSICGYRHEDPASPFESLPEDWVCPVCKAGKDKFELR